MIGSTRGRPPGRNAWRQAVRGLDHPRLGRADDLAGADVLAESLNYVELASWWDVDRVQPCRIYCQPAQLRESA